MKTLFSTREFFSYSERASTFSDILAQLTSLKKLNMEHWIIFWSDFLLVIRGLGGRASRHP